MNTSPESRHISDAADELDARCCAPLRQLILADEFRVLRIGVTRDPQRDIEPLGAQLLDGRDNEVDALRSNES